MIEGKKVTIIAVNNGAIVKHDGNTKVYTSAMEAFACAADAMREEIECSQVGFIESMDKKIDNLRKENVDLYGKNKKAESELAESLERWNAATSDNVRLSNEIKEVGGKYALLHSVHSSLIQHCKELESKLTRKKKPSARKR